MSLSVALQNARSGLAASSLQTALASQNAANVDSPWYARRRAELGPTLLGNVEVLAVQRAGDGPLLARLVEATAASAGTEALAAGLERLRAAGFDADAGDTLAALVGDLRDSLQLAASRPGDRALADAAVSSAGSLVTGLNEGARLVATARGDADAGIAASVGRLNGLLAEFEVLNSEVVRGARGGSPAHDAMDRRTQVLAGIATEVGVHVLERADGDVALFLDGGVTLFDVRPREIAFRPSGALPAGVAGNPVTVDGVAVTGPGAPMPLRDGALAGLVTLRDETAPALGRQLDEIARGLIDLFAESDQNPVPVLPTRPGLFTWSGDPAMPGAALVDGLALGIRLSAHANPAAGGDSFRIRDGGASDPTNTAYRYNPTGAAAFSGRLDALVVGLSQSRAFDPAAGLGGSASLGGFAEAGIGAFADLRLRTGQEAERRSLLAERLGAAHSNRTGVNLDDEMADLLRVERSYQASARVLATVDELLATLIDAVR